MRRRTNWTMWLIIAGGVAYVFREKLTPIFNDLLAKLKA